MKIDLRSTWCGGEWRRRHCNVEIKIKMLLKKFFDFLTFVGALCPPGSEVFNFSNIDSFFLVSPASLLRRLSFLRTTLSKHGQEEEK